MWLQNLPASVAVIWLTEVAKSFYRVLKILHLVSVLPDVLKSEVTEVQKFKLVQKNIIWLQVWTLKNSDTCTLLEIFQHELQISDQSVQLPATNCLIPGKYLRQFSLHIISYIFIAYPGSYQMHTRPSFPMSKAAKVYSQPLSSIWCQSWDSIEINPKFLLGPLDQSR